MTADDDPTAIRGQRARHRPKMTATAIRFPDDLHEKLRLAAEERDLSINYLVNRAVADFLPRLIPVEEFTLIRRPE